MVTGGHGVHLINTGPFNTVGHTQGHENTSGSLAGIYSLLKAYTSRGSESILEAYKKTSEDVAQTKDKYLTFSEKTLSEGIPSIFQGLATL